MNTHHTARKRINWGHITTVTSAVILIGTEVFGAAFAVGWALSSLFGIEHAFGPYGVYAVQFVLCAVGAYVMIAFCRIALRAESLVAQSRNKAKDAEPDVGTEEPGR